MVVDDEVIAAARAKLYAAVLSDVLDGLGYRHQVLPPPIRPLDEQLVLVGRARTGLYRDVYRVRGHNPYAPRDRADRQPEARFFCVLLASDCYVVYCRIHNQNIGSQ